MLEKLAMRYYAEEEISDTLQNEIRECHRRAKTFIPNDAEHVIATTHSFHDWYLTECSIYCSHGVKNCKFALSNGCITYYVLFSGVASLSFVGRLVSDQANYPDSDLNSSLAQILTLWLDYQESFEFCLLLDSERFITIQADRFSIRK